MRLGIPLAVMFVLALTALPLPAVGEGEFRRLLPIIRHGGQPPAPPHPQNGHTDHRPNRDRGGNHHAHNDGHDYTD